MIRSARWVVPIVVLSLVTSGCTSFARIGVQGSPPAPAFSNLKPGDTVRVTMRDRTRHTVTIYTVSDVVITSTDGRRFFATDIAGLERRHYDVKKNAGLVLAGVAITFLIGLAHAYGELLGGWS
jgi:hypothetical protein